MTYPSQRTLQADATGYTGEIKDQGNPLIITYPLGQSITLGIYTPAFGTTHTSSSQYGKVLQEVDGSWLVCFEDGGDNDFNDLVIRVTDAACADEHLIDDGLASDRVRVRYDPRFLGEPSAPAMVSDAAALAEAIRQRAISALTDPQTGYTKLYDSFGRAGDVPTHVDIDISCNPESFGVFPVATAATDGPNHSLFNTAWLRAIMQPYLDQLHNNATRQVSGTPWADTVDHELLHTLQGVAWSNEHTLLGYGLNYLGDPLKFESTAQAAEDFFADVDDFVAGQGTADSNGSAFLDPFRAFLSTHDSLIQGGYDLTKSYEFDGFFQYLGERFGSQVQTNLEARVAEFDRRLYVDDAADVMQSLANAIGGSKADVLDALRDFYLTLYVRQAANASSLPDRLRILDETTLHGQSPSRAAPVAGLSWGDVLRGGDPDHPEWKELITGSIGSTDVQLPKTRGLLLELAPAANTAAIEVTITNTSRARPNINLPVRVGFAGMGGSNHDQVVISPASFEVGPNFGSTQTYMIPAAGLSQVGLVIVAGSSDASFRLKIDYVSGTPALSIAAVVQGTTSDDSVVALVNANVDSFAARFLAPGAFTASIDGLNAQVKATFDLRSFQMLSIVPGQSLSAGTHSLALTFRLGNATASASMTFNVSSGGA
jgi:hypothetical protein